MIVTITGPSGAGKSSIAKRLLELDPTMQLVVSLTSRAPRPSDLPGEYRSRITMDEFNYRSRFNEFLWLVETHGSWYGTLTVSVSEALRSPSPSLMILVPEVLKLLYDHIGSEGGILPFYILSPSRKELHRRLEKRGDDEKAIRRRIGDCKKWDKEAGKSNIPYIFIPNKDIDTGIETAAETMHSLILYPPFRRK